MHSYIIGTYLSGSFIMYPGHKRYMPVYKKCPFCDEVFEIGPADDVPLRRHLRLVHAGQGGRVTAG